MRHETCSGREQCQQIVMYFISVTFITTVTEVIEDDWLFISASCHVMMMISNNNAIIMQ